MTRTQAIGPVLCSVYFFVSSNDFSMNNGIMLRVGAEGRDSTCDAPFELLQRPQLIDTSLVPLLTSYTPHPQVRGKTFQQIGLNDTDSPASKNSNQHNSN